MNEKEQLDQLDDVVITLNLGRDDECVSDYEDSDEEAMVHVVNWKKIKWIVGTSFPNPTAFKDVLTKYALAQGRSLKIAVSDKNKQNRLGVVCVLGCSFRLYASWDKKKSEYTVK